MQGADTSSSGGSASLRMEDKEELAIIQHGGTLSAEDQTKPPSMTSCLLPARSLRSTAAIIVPVPVPAAQAQGGDLGIRSLSLSKLLSFRMARALSSLSRGSDSILDHDASNSSALTLEKDDTKELELELKQVCRSQSVPTSVRRLRRVVAADSTSSSHWRLRVVPDLVDPHPTTEAAVLAPTGEEEEDIAAEEAVCRICMVALSEEAVLKLECCCKGELALAHRGCAIKWFSIKGNGTCDVCGQEVLNLPVTLRRLSSISIQAAVAQAQAGAQQQQQHAAADATAAASRRYRIVWHGTPILVIISMLAYFCFLEQLLAGRRPRHGGSGHLLALRLCPRPLLLSNHNKDGVQEICLDLRCAAIPLHCALHPPLLQICADASCDRHHPLHLRRLQRGHLHQLLPPPDPQMEGQASCDHNHSWRTWPWFKGAISGRP